MPEEPGWTLDSLREHLLSVVDANTHRLEQRIDDTIATRALLFDAIHTTNSRVDQRFEEMAALIDLTVGSLDKLTDAKFVTFRTLVDSQAEKVGLALASADKAVLKAEAATERRFESVNEFRATLSDQASSFIPRKEAEQRIEVNAARVAELAERLNQVNRRLDQGEGRTSGRSDSTRNLVTIVGILLTAITVFIGAFVAFR